MRNAAATALVVALLLSGCTTDQPRQATGVPFVAFRDLPPPPSGPQEQPGRPTPEAPPGTPDCRPDQVEVEVVDGSVPSQPVLSALRLTATQVRGPACALREGPIPVTALDAAGADLGVDSLPSGEQSLSGSRLLVPGSTTRAFLTWRRSDCDTPLAAIRLPLVPGGEPTAPLTVSDPPCLTPLTPITVKGWGQPFTATVAPPSTPLPPWSVLEARVLPLTEDDRITVRLRNPTGRPVPLEPCPGLSASVRDEPADEVVAQVSASVDCERAPAVLDPGEEVDLEVVLGPLGSGRRLRTSPDREQSDGTLGFGLVSGDPRGSYANVRLDLELR